MALFFMVLMAAAVLIAAAIGFRKFKTPTRPRNRRVAAGFSRLEPFLSPAEVAFYNVLEKILGPRYRVFGKVRVADLLNVEAKGGQSEGQGAFHRISRKHVDFVICDAENFSVIGAIELYDAGPDRPQSQPRDTFVQGAFSAAGIPLVHFSVFPGESPNQIAERLSAEMGLDPMVKQSPSGNEAEMPLEAVPAMKNNAAAPPGRPSEKKKPAGKRLRPAFKISVDPAADEKPSGTFKL